MKIRKANIGDAKQLAGLDLALRELEETIEPEISTIDPSKRHLFLKDCRKDIKNKKNLILVVEDKGEIVGFLFAKVKKRPTILKLKKTIEIDALFIRQKYRRKGLAKRLIKEAIRHYLGTGIKHFTLGVLAANTEAKKAYKNLGFRPYCEQYVLKIPLTST